MQLDLMTAGLSLRQTQDLAVAAADAGVAGLVVTEGGRTAYLSCAVAAVAADLHLSTGIAVAFPRSPMVTASIAWELAEATGGKFRLGLGTQVRAHVERRYSADFDPPGPRLREYVEAIRAIFSGFRGEERLAFEGDYWSFSLLPRQWSPGPIEPANPAIDIAAVNPWMLRMAGEVADGVHIHPLHTTTYLRDTVLPMVATGAAKVGRDPADVSLLVPTITIVGDTPEEQQPWRDMAKMQIAFYGSTPNYSFLFDDAGFEGTTSRLREKQKAGDIAGMTEIIDDEILDQFSITATWDELADKIIDRYDGVAERVVSYFAAFDWLQDSTALGRWGEVARAVAAH